MTIDLCVKGEPFGHKSAQPRVQWIGSVFSRNIMVISCQEMAQVSYVLSKKRVLRIDLCLKEEPFGHESAQPMEQWVCVFERK